MKKLFALALVLLPALTWAGQNIPEVTPPSVLGSSVTFQDDTQLIFGTGSDAACEYDTAQTPDSLFCGLGSDSRVLIVGEKADISTNLSIAQKTNPTVHIHAADAATTTKWIELFHDGTNGVVDVGTGVVSLPDGITAAIGQTTPAAGSFTTLSASGFLTLSTTAGITASTTQTQGQGALTTTVNDVATCANTNDTVTLPAAVAGRIVYIFNNGAQTLQIYPASGDAIDDGAANASKTQGTGVNITYIAHDGTTWNRIHSPL